MERLGGGLRKGGAAAATGKRNAAPAKGKFKLSTSKDPLPLLTKMQSRRETKPKAKFLTSAGAGTSMEKQNSTKPSIFAANSFIRPQATDGPPKKSTGFSFMKFQPKSNGLGKMTGNSSVKATPVAFTSTKPLLRKFSVNGLAKKTMNSTNEAGLRRGKEPLFKSQAKGGLPFAFRADTKSSAAKKRNAAESIAHDDRKNAFPCKTGRAKSSHGFMLKNPGHNKEEKDTGKQSEACVENAQRGDSIRSNVPIAIKMGGIGVKVDDGATAPAVLKKRGLLLTSTKAGPAPKKSKRTPQIAVQRLENSGVIKPGSSSGYVLHGDRDSRVSPPLMPTDVRPKQTPSDFGADAANSVQSSAASPSSRDCKEECFSGIEEELAIKVLCTLDDDKEDEFLARAAAIQEFTDRVGLEQKQIRKRLLNAHADVSESLLDALTDLMTEEGGIGIDKLDFDMNIDVDVGDAFLQDDEILVLP